MQVNEVYMGQSDQAEQAIDFTVNRDRWANQDIYFGADAYISKVHEKDKIKCRIIGLSEYKFLILETPMIIGLRAKFPVGSTAVVKFGKAGTIYGFYAEVLQTQFEPSSLMYLKYPQEVESFEFRGCERFICNIPAHVTDGKTHYYCIIKDISSGGCQLTVRGCNLEEAEPIQPDENISLTVNMCGFGEMKLDCVIRNLQMQNECLSYGLQFRNSGVAYAKIEQYFKLLKD